MQRVTAIGDGAGTLYLVATPIGNLEDITVRASRILGQVSLIACEDTRRTKRLLAHLGVRTPTMSLHGHNERARIATVLTRLRQGQDIAVVTDAGMPGISDPGMALASAVAHEGVRVIPVPGPSAVTAAVALADFAADRFAFVGFLPRRTGQRRRALSSLTTLPMALVLFEAPHRLRQTLADIDAVAGGRRLLVARELTKIHEEVLRGTAADVLASLPAEPQGEVTLVLAGPADDDASMRVGETTAAPGTSKVRPALPPEEFVKRLLAEGLSRRDAASALAVAYSLNRRDAYKLAAG